MKKKAIAAIIGMVLLAAFMSGCLMDINEIAKPVPIVEPYITVQPEGSSHNAGSAPSGLQLSVVIDNWKASDGTLSYQWYTFDTIVGYLNGTGVTPVQNANSDTLTPTGLKTSAGARNYYYVEVTNTNPNASGKKTAVTLSEVAVISFRNPADPLIPVITRHPADGSARFGRPANPISVRARVGDDLTPPAQIGEVFYQWYGLIPTLGAGGKFDPVVITDAGGGIPVATELVGATLPVYTPPSSAMGDSYFFVKVTHTIGRTDDVIDPGSGNVLIPGNPGVSSVEYSVPATLNIRNGLRALAPVITEQPSAALYFEAETVGGVTHPADPVVPLRVVAESPDFGELTYQWYSNTSASAYSGGTAIANATSDTYIPSEASTRRFYYVVVKNTNENVDGARTATAASRPVNVRWASRSAPTARSTVTVNTTRHFNYIRGYGGMEVAWANFPETTPEDTELMYNPDRLGYNILRIMLPVTDTNIDIAMEKLVRERRQYYYDNVKIVNKYGGYVAAAPWSSPKEWKTNNSINGGGHLRHEYYQQYATYLKSFAQHMNNRGAPIYCISIQNEPNYTAGYDGCEWTDNEMRDFFLQVGVFTEGARGWGGGVQTPRVLTMNGESANAVSINFPAIDSAKAYAAVDLFGRHVYGDRRQNLWLLRPKVRKSFANDSGKDVWMTEHNINSANATAYPNDSTWNYVWRYMNDVDLVMRLNNENAFIWWASKRFYSMIGDGQYGTPSGVALPRGWGLSHYAKYTTGATRVAINVAGTLNNGTLINYQRTADDQDADSNAIVNGIGSGDGDMDNGSARITAYAWFKDEVDRDGNPIKVPREISLVLMTPTDTKGDGGHDLGTVQIDMPTYSINGGTGGNTWTTTYSFKIIGATGIQSYKVDSRTNRYQEAINPGVSSDRKSAFVTVPAGRIVSVKFQLEAIEE